MRHLLTELSGFMRFLGFPLFFTLSASLYYSHAILRGITCARDEQHRMTPESPWYFFNREFMPRGIRIALAILPWLALGTLVSVYMEDVRLNIQTSSLMKLLRTFDFPLFLFFLGLLCFSFAGITLFAPRISNRAGLSAIGTAMSFLAAFLLFALVETEILDFERDGVLNAFAIIGAVFFWLNWRYVRRNLDRAWFRFDC